MYSVDRSSIIKVFESITSAAEYFKTSPSQLYRYIDKDRVYTREGISCLLFRNPL